MARYANPRELLQRMSALRRDHSHVRSTLAQYMAVQLAYATGRQWTSISRRGNGTTVEQWDEDWSGKAKEMKVVDNQIGRLRRQIVASTNASSIEARVSPHIHQRGSSPAVQARSAQIVLNGIAEPCGFTRAFRAASSLRWTCGSSLIVMETTRRRTPVDASFAGAGGGAVVDDSWISWRRRPITDLVWDPSNTSPDLSDHDVLMLEVPMTLRSFERQWGPIEDYGIDKDRLPTMREVAPYYVSAAGVAGCSLYSAYASVSEEKALRLVTFVERGENSPPGRFDCCWFVVEASGWRAVQADVHGTVINWDEPYGQWGGSGRPMFKLDAFRRDDSCAATGLPGILMVHQDLVNIARSTQFQQMVAVIHGQWLLDRRSANRDEFMNQLSNGIGGVLQYDSMNGQVPPPAFVQPQAPSQVWPIISADLSQSMQANAHLTAQNMGVAKSHVPEEIQREIIASGNVVMDQIAEEDHEEVGRALTATLGTVRMHIEKGGSVLGHLRDVHGFTAEDVMNVLEIDPQRITLDIKAVKSRMVNRPADQRAAEISNAAMTGMVHPMQARTALAADVNRPVIDRDEQMVAFADRCVRMVEDGQEWPGVPSLDATVFTERAQRVLFQLDLRNPTHIEAARRLEEAIQRQKAIAAENPELQHPGLAAQPGGGNNGGGGSARPAGRTAPSRRPGSIDATASPIGAAGGLPLGLPPSFV